MRKSKYILASVILCLSLFMSTFADDGETGSGNRSDNPPASGSSNSVTTNPFQDVLNSLLNYMG